MPSFIVFALWVGADSWVPPREMSIIREKANESKGLLPSVVLAQVIERTDFFGQAARERHRLRHAFWRASALFHGVEELVVVLRRAQLVEQEFGRLELVHAEEQLPQDPHLGQDVGRDQQLLAPSAGAVHVD